MMVRVVWQKGSKIVYKHFSGLLSYEQADKMHFGRTVVIGFSLPLWKRVMRVLRDFVGGVCSGYPFCCIFQYCLDRLFDRPSAQLRWSNRTEYVECWVHIRKNGRNLIPADLY
jgi:hypothetical protein